MCTTESLCCTADWHSIVNQLYFNLKKFKEKENVFQFETR